MQSTASKVRDVPLKRTDSQSPPSDDLDRSGAADAIAGVPAHELEGYSLYEKKCVLINHEIDSNGMGRYQWYIWILCGFGYWLDLLWAQAFGLVLSPLKQELGFGGDQSGNISVGAIGRETFAEMVD